MNSFITIKWIHLFCTARIYEFIYCMNSCLYKFIYLNHWIHRIYEFLYCMNSCILKQKKSRVGLEPCTTKPIIFCHTTNDLPHCIIFLQYIYYFYYMILMSEKMTSQTNTDEFITRSTNKSLCQWAFLHGPILLTEDIFQHISILPSIIQHTRPVDDFIGTMKICLHQ